MNRLERDIPTPEDLHDTIVRLTALVEQQEAEIERLRKLAPWHDTPRVQPHDKYGVPCREGHLVFKWDGVCGVLFDGDYKPTEFQSSRVYYTNGDPVSE